MISLTADLKERLRGIEPREVNAGQRTDLLIFEIVKAAKLPVQDYSLDLSLTFPLLWPRLEEMNKTAYFRPYTRLFNGLLDIRMLTEPPVYFLQEFDHLEAIHLCRAVIFVAKNLPEEGGELN